MVEKNGGLYPKLPAGLVCHRGIRPSRCSGSRMRKLELYGVAEVFATARYASHPEHEVTLSLGEGSSRRRRSRLDPLVSPLRYAAPREAGANTLKSKGQEGAVVRPPGRVNSPIGRIVSQHCRPILPRSLSSSVPVGAEAPLPSRVAQNLATLREMASTKKSSAKPAVPRRAPPPLRLIVDPVSLHLDLANPRLAQADTVPSEREVVYYLAKNCDLAELVQSIAANGYLDFEPLIVVEEVPGRLTVIEGNRRVAAVKVLTSPEKYKDLGFTVPEVPEDLQESLSQAGAIKISDRADARKFIGFKHINGPHKWDSYAKAKFAAEWFRADRNTGITLRDIARRLGDRHDTVLRLVQGMFVLEQAKAQSLFDMEDRYDKRPFSFSHLYTALTRREYRDYLGLTPQWREAEPGENLVPPQKHPQLKQVLTWMYGSDIDRRAPVVTSQNPHVKQLGEVLANPIARKKLESTNSLSEAHREVDSRARKFGDALIRAYEHAEVAQQSVDAYEPDEALAEVAQRLLRISRSIHAVMVAVQDPAS